jgi:hypothetical protein
MPSFLPTDGVTPDVTHKPPLHVCRHCGKEFKYIKRRDIHEETCSEMAKTVRNDYDDKSRALTMHDLLSVIMELKHEVKELREELKAKGGVQSRRPVEIVEWLDDQPKPHQSLKEYLNDTVVCSNGDLQTLFQRNFVEAVTEIMHKYILSQEEASIRAFTQKDQVLYHFNGKNWNAINNEEWECIVGIFVSKLATAFSAWSQEHITDLGNASQQDDWLEKTKKIHDASPTRFSSIKRRIYNYIKVDIRQV